jgi:hypothetical protein
VALTPCDVHASHEVSDHDDGPALEALNVGTLGLDVKLFRLFFRFEFRNNFCQKCFLKFSLFIVADGQKKEAGANTIKLFTDFHNKLECLFLASLSSLV